MSTGGEGKKRGQFRAIIAICVVAILLVIALVSAIGALNRDVYSAGGFVRQYLDALARKDTVGALALAGVEPTNASLEAAGLPQNLPDTLLRPSVLGDLTDIRQVSDTETSPGTHTVVYEFSVDGEVASMSFSVRGDGTFAGVFNSWSFAASPLAVLQVTVLHAATFTVNGLTLDTRALDSADDPATFSNQAAYLAFAPARYTVQHDSTLLGSDQVITTVTQAAAVDVTVDAQPNANMISQVQSELNNYLDSCAEQQVLQPSNCPFGIEINDRVKGLPTWSIPNYPAVTLSPGQTTFDMAPTPGVAHIVVEVQSLFDGEISTKNEDVDFEVGLSVTVNGDGSLVIQLH
ncbi:hypothetical protein [Leifsonia sp. A12D58]|uniref:hypothetical protein n=1 Tax=Leifsonia sp. A12D58 TaxID=3397674 RepID=UPI0039E07A0C